MLDLIVLSILLMLTIYVLKEEINLSLFLLFIGMMTCFLERPLVVILIFDLSLSELLIAL